MSVSDRIVVMSQGRIEQIGTPEEVYRRPSLPFVARFVGRSSHFHAKVDTRLACWRRADGLRYRGPRHRAPALRPAGRGLRPPRGCAAWAWASVAVAASRARWRMSSSWARWLASACKVGRLTARFRCAGRRCLCARVPSSARRCRWRCRRKSLMVFSNRCLDLAALPPAPSAVAAARLDGDSG